MVRLNIKFQIKNLDIFMQFEEKQNLDLPTFDSSAAFVDYLTDYLELAERNKTNLSIKDPLEKAAFKKAM
jgi:hypothetical protein